MQTDLPALRADDTALFLDVDGTLLDIRSRPSDVVADAGLVAILERLARGFDGALALVSGRSVQDIDRVFSPVRFNAAGSHGAELRLAGRATPPPEIEPLPESVADRLAAFAEARDGLLLERKHGGVSLHYRRAPALEQACRDAVAEALTAAGDGYRLIDGKMVLEIAPRGHDKGEAIRTFLAYPPFAGRKPLFLGDDVTDEDGFRVANELGGASIRVGGIEQSEARHGLPDVAAVRQWLHSTAKAAATDEEYSA